MVSKTKYFLDETTVRAMLKKAGIENITKIAPLGDGQFNAVYEITADKSYVLKVAPKPSAASMIYENDMMRAEVFWYNTIRKNTDIKVPDVYYTDFSKELIASDWFVMEKLKGKQQGKSGIRKNIIIEKNAEMLAEIHKVKNDKFGYIQNQLYDNWYDALTNMIKSLLKDAQRINKKSKQGEKLLSYTQKYKDILINVPCCMVNYDLWSPNIICRFNDNNEIEFQWIDPERSFWGDRIFDFITLENPIGYINHKTKSIEHYNKHSANPIVLNKETQIRFALGMGLLALIQEVEKYYRYTPRNFGWWLNIMSHTIYYKKAFKVLKNG